VRWKKFTQHSGGSLVVDSLLFLLLQLCIEGFITVTFGLSALLRLPVVLEFLPHSPEGSLVSLSELDIGGPFTNVTKYGHRCSFVRTCPFRSSLLSISPASIPSSLLRSSPPADHRKDEREGSKKCAKTGGGRIGQSAGRERQRSSCQLGLPGVESEGSTSSSRHPAEGYDRRMG
jgi:hypothetical protein